MIDDFNLYLYDRVIACLRGSKPTVYYYHDRFFLSTTIIGLFFYFAFWMDSVFSPSLSLNLFSFNFLCNYKTKPVYSLYFISFRSLYVLIYSGPINNIFPLYIYGCVFALSQVFIFSYLLADKARSNLIF